MHTGNFGRRATDQILPDVRMWYIGLNARHIDIALTGHIDRYMRVYRITAHEHHPALHVTTITCVCGTLSCPASSCPAGCHMYRSNGHVRHLM